MGRTARRKQHKRAKRLNHLAQTEAHRFCQEWQTRVAGWLQEIHHRARLLQSDAVASASAERIFDVLDCAKSALAILAPETRQLVLAETLDVLHNACARAVAQVYDPRLYRVIDHPTYQVGRDWQRHRAALDANGPR